jgi:hypothetical protein
VKDVGVGINPDVGLCLDPGEDGCQRYRTAVLDFLSSLQPQLEIGVCLLTHAEPWLDPHQVEDRWYLDGPPDAPWKLAQSLAATPHRVRFLGTSDGLLPWRGDLQLCLDKAK